MQAIKCSDETIMKLNILNSSIVKIKNPQVFEIKNDSQIYGYIECL